MRTLLLLRHAKSDWSADYGHDHDRPLNKRGRRAASDLGRWLRLTGEVPDLVVCSTATRARDTVERAMQAGQWACPTLLDERIYSADGRRVAKLIRTFDDSASRILVAGHEPGIATALSLLLGRAPVRFPTAAIARIDLQVKCWKQVRPGVGSLVWFVPPRLIERAVID